MPSKPRMNSRGKGKAGELELAKFLTVRRYPAKRGQQFHGGADSPDVVSPSLEGIHIECKRVENGSMYMWLDQAIEDANGKKVPTVWHRKNKRDWIVILRADDFLNLFLTRSL